VRKQLAYVMSLLVLTSALWGPFAPVEAQNVACIGPGCSGSAGAATVGGNNVFTGSNQFTDSLFTVVDDGDTTKKLAFQVSGVSTGTTRTMTVQNSSGTLALLEAGQTFSGQNTFSNASPQIFSVAGGGVVAAVQSTASDAIRYNTVLTPDGMPYMVGSTANSLRVYEHADLGSDLQNGPCGSAACTDPTIMVFDTTAATTSYGAMAAYGTAGGTRKTLTETTATSTIRIPVAAGAGAGGTFNYCVFASDATDQQQRCSRIKFSVTNKAAAETCGLNTDTAVANDASITETEDGNAASISAGTLTYAITCDVTPANAVDIQVNATSSLTQTTLEARYWVQLMGPGQPARQ